VTDEFAYGPGRPPAPDEGAPPPDFRDIVTWVTREPPPKFQHRYRTHIILFALTLLTTTFPLRAFAIANAPFYWIVGDFVNPLAFLSVNELVVGLWYSIPLLAFLSAHEFGHYFACRYYNVDATLPYYIPAPVPLTGTLGAVIRIREPFPSKKALFDIGVAGPIAGFLVLLPLLFWGVSASEMGQIPPGEHFFFSEPLILKAAMWLFFGPKPEGQDLFLHPVGLAAWWGCLATALNLLPFGQLDGGHVTYAAFGLRARLISIATLLTVMVMAAISASWILMAVMMSVMAFFFGFGHPRVWDESVPLDSKRRLVAILALIIFVMCFTPIPVEIVGGE
jgi:membrane-associated protease RseP (regulator of RpoE activity)